MTDETLPSDVFELGTRVEMWERMARLVGTTAGYLRKRQEVIDWSLMHRFYPCADNQQSLMRLSALK